MNYYKQKEQSHEEMEELLFWLVIIGVPVCLVLLLISWIMEAIKNVT